MCTVWKKTGWIRLTRTGTVYKGDTFLRYLRVYYEGEPSAESGFIKYLRRYYLKET